MDVCKWISSWSFSERMRRFLRVSGLSGIGWLLCIPLALADPPYRLNPGDRIDITVWHEDNLHTKTVILPDGTLSVPLVGQVTAAGKTLIELGSDLRHRLADYLATPEVNVRLVSAQGNKVYVTGEVVHPGAFIMVRPTDVMQALSMAGGLTPYAHKSRIQVLRRETGGRFTRFPFDYGDVEDGDELDTNIPLKGGDTIVVP